VGVRRICVAFLDPSSLMLTINPVNSLVLLPTSGSGELRVRVCRHEWRAQSTY